MFNFQHTPLAKYLYGISSRISGSPYPVQFTFGLTFIALTYFLGVTIFHSRTTGTVAGLLVLTDPVFSHLLGEILLDLPQATFLLAFVLLVLHGTRFGLVHGILLGCAAASKFWTPVAVTAVLAVAYDAYRTSRFDWRNYIVTAAAAGAVLYASYFRTILESGGITPILLQAKIFKYWLHHSISALPGANVFLFLTGFSAQWWGEKAIGFSPHWSLLWPISLAGVLTAVILRLLRSGVRLLKEPPAAALIFPVLYLLSLSVQAPFVRYFLLLLPFLYAGMTALIIGIPDPLLSSGKEKQVRR